MSAKYSREYKRKTTNYKIRRAIVILLFLVLVAAVAFLIFDKTNKGNNTNANGGVVDNSTKKEIAKTELEKFEVDSNKVTLYFNNEVNCSLDGEIYSEKNNVFELNKANNIDVVYVSDENNEEFKFEIGKYVRLYDKSVDSIFIALEAEEDINYILKELDNYEITFDDEDIISVDGTKIFGKSLGSTYITVKTPMTDVKFKVVVTDLISKKGDDFDYYKPYLSPGIYSKEDNDTLDEILVSRVNRGGYHTRAGVVEAGRFITMEFPYRINYFSENGRMADSPKADGEGRFYHKGLYLHESRFSVLNSDYIVNGPNPWGYPIYSNPAGGERLNGLDCSGLISWIVYQGGYDPTDMGAGVDDWRRDFTDLGEKEHITDYVMQNNLKVGDLLSGDGEVTDASSGGHIAMLIGIKDGYYYVAEELWGSPSLSHGAVAMRYSYDSFKYYFYWRIDMDEYYGEDGNLTEFWN